MEFPTGPDPAAYLQGVGMVAGSPSLAYSKGGIRPLTRAEVAAQVEAEILDSLGFYGSSIDEQRRINIRRYQGKPLGNEVEGSSSAQVSVVQDTVEWMMPGVMKAIFGNSGRRLWEFLPTQPGEEIYAEQATDAVNAMFTDQCDGFAKIHDFVKTALLEKRGYLAVYWDERKEPQKETYRGLTQNMIGVLETDTNIEILELGPHKGEAMRDPQTGQPTEVYDVTIRRVTARGRVRIDSIPPEHMLVPRRITAISNDMGFIGYRKRMTISELISLGFNPEVVALLPTDNMADFRGGEIDRLYDEATFPGQVARTDGASREIWVNFTWIRIDEDGDGYAELRHIICVGDTAVQIIYDEEVSHNPIVSICPIPMPHKFHGTCPADQAVDGQNIQSTILRQLLDNMYRVNNARYLTLHNQVNLNDLVSNLPGSAIRVKNIEAVKPLMTPPLNQNSFQLLGFMNQLNERRTGVSSWQQGPDAADMKYQTGGAVSAVQTASESKINLINLIFGHTGLKSLGEKILQVMTENFAGPFTFRLRGQWVEADPRSWNAKMTCQTIIGLGVGEMEARVGKLSQVAAMQGELIQKGAHWMVTPRQLYSTAKELIHVLELGPPDKYFTDPGPEFEWPKPQPKLVDRVKLMESERRSIEDEMVDNQKTMEQAVEATANEQLAQFRYYEIAQETQIKREQMANAKEIAEMQMRAQVESAMANHQAQRRAA